MLGLVAVFGAISAPLGWAISDRLERDNDFCVSCHLPSGTPLHQSKMDDFRGAPAASLVAAHFDEGAGGESFRCIDCHGGASFPNKLRVKLVAARDALRWLVGRFEEPTRMAHPLWDEDCAQCHASYAAERDDDFHAIQVHNVDFAYRCVDCHRAHATEGVASEFDYLDRAVVLPICRNCHEEF